VAGWAGSLEVPLCLRAAANRQQRIAAAGLEARLRVSPAAKGEGEGIMRIYVASSWRNPRQQEVVRALREAGQDAYDFRHPAPGNNGFHWSEIDPAWKNWGPQQFREGLLHPTARKGFRQDYDAMRAADACVLVLPAGRSAHLEAGWFTGCGVPVWVLLAPGEEPELMYALAARLVCDVRELVNEVTRIDLVERVRNGAGAELRKFVRERS
jgi:nucleoside 2-deoxyribosyltransferase